MRFALLCAWQLVLFAVVHAAVLAHLDLSSFAFGAGAVVAVWVISWDGRS